MNQNNITFEDFKKLELKMFTNLHKQESLVDNLAAFTKNDLDQIRKDLSISGVSSLNKKNLAIALDVSIKNLLPEILGRFTNSEYILVKHILKHKGILKYNDKLSADFYHLRPLGIIGCFKDDNDQDYIFIPKDIVEDIGILTNTLNIVYKIKQNEKVIKFFKGLLFYYGALPFEKVHTMINIYLKEPLDELTIFDTIYENTIRTDLVYYYNNYWYLPEVINIEELISEQNKRSTLNYVSLTKNQVLKASESNFIDLKEEDINLIGFLCENFDISSDEAAEYVASIIFSFKAGCPYNDIVGEFSSIFNMEILEQLKESVALITKIYNNSVQWALKGFSPSTALI